MRKLVLRAVLTLLAIASLAVAGKAQGTSATILGTVYDQSRAVLPGVTVTATEKDTGLKRTVVSDDEGRYIMAQMKIGAYAVEAELVGFQTATRDVQLTLTGEAVADFTLGVGAAGTEVTVTSEAPLVETTSSSVANLVDQQQIRDLPLNGRSFTDLATMQMGVIVDYYGSRAQIGVEGAKISIAGTRLRQTLYQLDGTDMRNQKSANPGSLAGGQLGVDTVQEFNVITTVANAEYGHFTGGVINAVTKSGTNAFHGTLFEFLRNSALDARNFFDRDLRNPLVRSSPAPYRRNQYGFTAGGPIRKDRVFFFGSFEGLKDRLTTTETGLVPSTAARAGSIVPVSPVVRPIVDAWPLPNGTQRADGTADYVYTPRQEIDEEFFVGKVDFQISQNDSVAVRYLLDQANRIRPNVLDVLFDYSITRNQFSVVEWKRLISAKMINEARFSMNRSFSEQNPVEHKPLPAVMHFNPVSFNFTGDPWHGTVSVPGLTALGFSANFGQHHAFNRFQYIDNLSYTTGAHSIKSGFNIHRLQLNSAFPNFVSGNYTFVNLRDFLSAAQPRTYNGTTTGSIPRGMRQIIMGFYVQDDWRVRQNVTLNLGVRYEPFTRPVEVKGRLGNLRNPSDTAMTVGNPLITVNPSYKNFSPRIGVAWDPFKDGKTSIRAGYGLFFELIQPLHYWSSIFTNAPFSVRFTLDSTTVPPQRVPFPNPFEGLSLDPTQIITSPWVFSDAGLKQGGVHQYQFSIQRELPGEMAVQVAYMGSQGYNLGHMLDSNTAVPQRDAQGVYPFFPATAVRRNPRFGQIRNFAWDETSAYNSLGVTVRKRFSKGYSFQTSFTYGKSIDDTSTSGVGEARSQPNGLSTFPEDIHFDRSVSDFDVRKRLSVNGSWDLPIGRGRAFGNDWNGVMQQVLGGWTLNSIFTASEGNWANIRIPFNHSRSRQGVDIPDRPSLIVGGNQNPILSDGRDPNLYFDGSQFVLGPAGYFGNLGRNTLRLPGILAVDLSIQKNFNFTEERYLQFRGEMFNIANRANFGLPDTATIQTAAGARSSTTGRITSTSTAARQVQFALKIYF